MGTSESVNLDVRPHVPVYMGVGGPEDRDHYIFVGTAEISKEDIVIRLSDKSNQYEVAQVLESHEVQGLFLDAVAFNPDAEVENPKDGNDE